MKATKFMYYVKFLNKVIDSMFPDDCSICAEKCVKCGLKDYILLLLSTFLDGSTKDEQFHIWMGSGANGKSLLIELFQDALGDYVALDNTFLLQRTKSGNATPELFDTKNKRFIVVQETDTKAQIQTGLLKQLTGGDKITARGLYKDIETFKPQFKMVLVLITCLNYHRKMVVFGVVFVLLTSFKFVNQKDRVIKTETGLQRKSMKKR